MTAETTGAAASRTARDPDRALRIGRRVILAAVAVFVGLYYPVPALLAASLIPFVALTVVGFVVGFAARGRTGGAYSVVAGLVVGAVVLRRVATWEYGPETFMFDGALAGYPAWSLWLAEVLRVGANLWFLWIGGQASRELRYQLGRGRPG